MKARGTDRVRSLTQEVSRDNRSALPVV